MFVSATHHRFFYLLLAKTVKLNKEPRDVTQVNVKVGRAELLARDRLGIMATVHQAWLQSTVLSSLTVSLRHHLLSISISIFSATVKQQGGLQGKIRLTPL